MRNFPWKGFFSVCLITFILVSLVAAATSCAQQAQSTTKLGVVVTILPQAEFVENVGGDKVDITVMVPPGASPQTYEPTPSQMTDLSEAEIYAKVRSGVEFELTWMEKLIAQNDDILVVAPCGLNDLFQMILRRNPRRVSQERFRQRVREKEIQDKWPQVRVIDG